MPASPDRFDNSDNNPPDPNASFRLSRLTYLTMAILLIALPVLSIATSGSDNMDLIKKISESRLLLIGLILNVVFQWCIFLLIWLAVWRENTGLEGIGFTPFRMIHLAWAGALFLAAITILLPLGLLLEELGLGIPGELGLLVPKDPLGRVVWVLVSITAGVTEEAAFRGYLITRLQKLGKTAEWLLPSIIASIVFGIGHTYQGVGGFILITVYGGLFALTYWYTRSLWPCIIAHSFQDLSHLFIPW